MIEPETIIDGRYRVLSRLGSGGMADVYLAQDQLLGRQVAVKVLHHHFAADQEFVERFRREASSAAALSHPNIVGIFDRGEWDGTYYIAMEYVAGRSLKSIVRENGPLAPAAAIDVVEQILRAAQFAHRRGVIHRDLKPHNVILDDDGRARVTDFGIARAGASDMTLTGSIMGTAQYLSPEQAQGFSVTSTSDIYSVGVILYELLTGVVPFEGETAVAIAFKQVSAAPRPPSELNPAIAPSLDAVVLRALAKDPAARYADAGELIAALEHERKALPAFSGAPVAVGASGSGAQDTASGLAGGPLLLAPAEHFGEEYGPPPQRDRRRRRLLLIGAALAVVLLAVLALLLLMSSTRTVPDVRGQSEQAATTALTRAGFTPVASQSVSTSVAKGLVISETPRAGSAAKKGARVQIVVSSGPASASLANVEGLTAAAAIARLRSAGFKPTTRSEASATVAASRVIGTTPPAGTEVVVGSPVTIRVSSGPPPVRVPALVGQTRSAAEATLTNAGLALGTVTQRTSTHPPETVLSQSPARGTSVRSGDRVNLTVAKATNEAVVPNVVGKNEALAAAALGQAGLTPSTRSEPTSEAPLVGVVLKQKPAAGTHARKGSTVTITVGISAPTTTPTTPTTPTTSTTTTPQPVPPAAP
ncbi:MAG: eukaryotic-like serine/threonine-protein kinase [Solirubrobacteraceae bacterium]|nr:eukaryotic-like serine/threonine-protein kinase [Solirubrobacteraceae bacterium]